ncbi:MAG TPA: hypothetical protein ENN13_02850 [Candidatus Altiarchaeales archaeon]|nr:hypothetical protein [Candidatus Altiarchaeales archaeon]
MEHARILASILVILLVFILVYGIIPSATRIDCENKCENQDLLKSMVSGILYLPNGGFTVQCSECSFGRGSGILARIIKNGYPIEIAHSVGRCEDGVDCGWSVCIKSFSQINDDSYLNAKSRYCGIIESNTGGKDDTEMVRGECMEGAFEYVGDGVKTLSIKQSYNKSSASVSKGPEECADFT